MDTSNLATSTATELMLRWRIDDDSPDGTSTTYDNSAPTSDSLDVCVRGEDVAGAGRELVPGRRRLYANTFRFKIIEQVGTGVSIVELVRAHSIRSPSSIHAWLTQTDKLRAACASKRRSKVCLGGQGRRPNFVDSDVEVQWIKEMRRDDFPLKTRHVVAFIKEELAEWKNAYVATRKPGSLNSLEQRMIWRHGISFQRPTRTLLSSEELLAQQRQFAHNVGVGARRAYPPSAIFNANKTGVYIGNGAARIVAERGSHKARGKVCGFRHS